MSSTFAEFDEIGYWSEVKLEIVRDYASAYSRILNSKGLPHIYVLTLSLAPGGMFRKAPENSSLAATQRAKRQPAI
jgi:hypothetical protein